MWYCSEGKLEQQRCYNIDLTEASLEIQPSRKLTIARTNLSSIASVELAGDGERDGRTPQGASYGVIRLREVGQAHLERGLLFLAELLWSAIDELCVDVRAIWPEATLLLRGNPLRLVAFTQAAGYELKKHLTSMRREINLLEVTTFRLILIRVHNDSIILLFLRHRILGYFCSSFKFLGQ